MATQIELAYRALHQILTEVARASDAGPDEVFRNRTVNSLLGEGRTGIRSIWNLVDAKGRFLAEEVNGPGEDGNFEIIQPAWLEIIVVEPDDAKRDEYFDASMMVLRDLFRDLDETLGGLVDDLSVTEPPDRMVLQGADSAKACRVMIDMTMTLPTVFG